ncbi:hypothetical protein K439DRAFT_1665684 [Ramaria rubella]|nr:hypothetical protein K439DRAFT_1665684 [Ramaria rubella]
MPSPHPKMPPVSDLVQMARNIVFKSKRDNNLSSLTVKIVRKQIEREFNLTEGSLDKEEFKHPIRDAVNKALAEDIPAVIPPAISSLKRDRSPEDVDGSESSARQKAKRRISQPAKEAGAREHEASKTKRRVVKSRAMVESDEESTADAGPAPDKSASSARLQRDNRDKPRLPKSGFKSTPAIRSPEGNTEASDLSDDELPKKKGTKRKSKGGDNGKTTKSTKDKEPANVSDQDEQTIKRLKSYVSACGLRKVWSKEFADLPQPRQQIRHLKAILTDLGMTGRLSMDQAKAIKRKRALARELNDVIEFERKAGVSRSRQRQESKAKRTMGELDTDSEVGESSEEEEEEVGKKSTASGSIMAYLANQSSDDE